MSEETPKKTIKEIEKEDEEVLRSRRYERLLQEREMAFAEEERTLLAWKAASRPKAHRDQAKTTTIIALIVLVAVILMFAREFMLIAVILAVAFLVMVFDSIEPETVEHRITSRGIRTGGSFYRWDMLNRFWFGKRHGVEMLRVETLVSFPTQLLLVLGEADKKEVKKIMQTYVLYEVPEPTWNDKVQAWVSKKFPLEESKVG